MAGKAKHRPHYKQAAPSADEIPKIEFDYCFPGDKHGDRITVLTAIGSENQLPDQHLLPGEGCK